MKPGAARLLLFNGAPAYRRLAGIVVGVAIGVGMLLVLLGAYLHIPDRDDRASWLRPQGQFQQIEPDGTREGWARSDEHVLATSHVDVYDDQTFEVLVVASTASTEVVFPGGLEPPAPGEFYASAAMSEIVAHAPADQLSDRWGEQRGELPPDLVKGPTHRVVLAGAEWDAVARLPNAVEQIEFRDASAAGQSTLYQIIVAMGAIALLVPITLLISIVSALGAAERRERLATVRLIGAGRRTVAVMSGGEMAMASLLGAVGGVGVAALLRPLAAELSIGGSTLYPSDLSLSPGWVIGVVAGIAVLGGLAAGMRAYRDDVGALGATREREERPVTAWRASTLLIGLVMFAGSAYAMSQMDSGYELFALGLVLGFAFIAFGIVIAGPWITRLSSRILGAATSSASGLVAAGRLRRHPRATFRSVAGLVVAVFVVSVFAGGSSAIALTTAPRELPGRMDVSTLVTSVLEDEDAHTVAERMSQVEGVEHVVIGWRSADPHDNLTLMDADDARIIGAANVPKVPTVAVDVFAMMADNGPGSVAILEDPVAAAVSLEGLGPREIIVTTSGDTASLERVRTALSNEVASTTPPGTRIDHALRGALQPQEELAVMAYLGMALAITVSALALTVATVAAVLDRRRTFGLLRLGGMPVRQLRMTTVKEAAVPLAATLIASAGLGYGVAAVTIDALSPDLSVTWPDPRYWWAMGASLVIAALALTSTFGAVRRSTEVESTRFE